MDNKQIEANFKQDLIFAKLIANIQTNNSSDKTIFIDDYKWPKEKFEIFCAALNGNNDLEYIGLKSNKYGIYGLQLLCYALSDNFFCKLKYLDFSKYSLGAEELTIISNLFKYSKNLNIISLDLIKCNLNVEGIKILCDGLKQNYLNNICIENLNLSGNNIGDEGFKLLVEYAKFEQKTYKSQCRKLWINCFKKSFNSK